MRAGWRSARCSATASPVPLALLQLNAVYAIPALRPDPGADRPASASAGDRGRVPCGCGDSCCWRWPRRCASRALGITSSTPTKLCCCARPVARSRARTTPWPSTPRGRANSRWRWRSTAGPARWMKAWRACPSALLSVGSVLATAWLGRRASWGRDPAFGRGCCWRSTGLRWASRASPNIKRRSCCFRRWRCWRPGSSAAPATGAGWRWPRPSAPLRPGLALRVWPARPGPGLARLVGRAAQHRCAVVLWITIIVAALAGGVLLAAAYVPALLAPYFATTQGYLTNRMGEVGTFNMPFFVEMGTFYNSTYFFAGLVILVTLGTILGWSAVRNPAGCGGAHPLVAARSSSSTSSWCASPAPTSTADGKLVAAGVRWRWPSSWMRPGRVRRCCVGAWRDRRRPGC